VHRLTLLRFLMTLDRALFHGLNHLSEVLKVGSVLLIVSCKLSVCHVLICFEVVRLGDVSCQLIAEPVGKTCSDQNLADGRTNRESGSNPK